MKDRAKLCVLMLSAVALFTFTGCNGAGTTAFTPKQDPTPAPDPAPSPNPTPTTGPEEWTWVGGSSTLDNTNGQRGVYGTLGVPAAGNVPGGRYAANSWTDQSGHLWLFGGAGSDANDGYGRLNDLWEFDPSATQWTWMGGGDTVSQPGVYGKLGVPAAGNLPGSREMATSWTDKSGNLWLFGGIDVGYGSAYQVAFNDLWEFSLSTNQWSWMGGSSPISCSTFCGDPGVYGTLGTPAAGNIPGSRGSAMSWIDSSGNLWLFGGVGYDANGKEGSLNDLWKFDPSTNLWAWMGGSSTMTCANDSCGAPGVYGALGTPAAGNIPGGRWSGSSWTDSSGNLWLFGGLGRDANGNFGDLNDLWEFNPSTNQWAWVGGSSTMIYENEAGEYSQPGVYGTLGVPAAGNIPGGRDSAVSWTDSGGNFWLFGGQGADASGNGGPRNDLWEFSPSTVQWTWMGGSSQIPCVVLYQGVNDPLEAVKCGVNGVYGTLGAPAAGNLPGSRFSSVSWTDGNGNLWLFGGAGLGSTGGVGDLNDLWEYQP